MFFKVSKYIFCFVSTLLLTLSVFAADADESKKSEGDGQSREWSKKEGYLKGYETQRKSLYEEIQRLIREKNKSTDQKQIRALVDQIALSHKALDEVIIKYNKAKLELKYRYPERKAQTDRKYPTMRKQSVEEIEKEMGLDAVLTKVKKQIDQKYEPFTEGHLGEKPLSEVEKKVLEKRDEERKRQRLRLVQ